MKKLFAWLLFFTLLGSVCATAESGLRADATEAPRFETPEPAPAPSPDAIAEQYFGVLAAMETGSAGASLKTAAAADKVCAFAVEYALWNPDVETLRANMLTAFESLSASEQEAAQAGFDEVMTLLDSCLADWEANRPLFADAGAADTMDAVMLDPLNRLAWENLRNHTLTMGNDPATEGTLSFEQLAGLDWIFSSGAGAWSTEMIIGPDGSFKGEYHDSEMGDTAEAYPNGTTYICVFSGQMSFGAALDEHRQEIRIDQLTLQDQPGQEEIEDGVRFVFSEAYGISEGDTMVLYLPGTPVEALTEEMQMWAHLFEMEEESSELKDYFLCSEANGSGFIASSLFEPAGLANPWTDMTADELSTVSGIPYALPEGAETVVCRWLESEQLAEIQFTLDEDEFNYRFQPAELEAGELMNISGMYFGWDQKESVSIAHCNGDLGIAKTGSSDWTELCLWYDMAPGIMYSLSVYTTDPDGLDLAAVAEQVFVPAQGDV